jgi:hypothetical protein
MTSHEWPALKVHLISLLAITDVFLKLIYTLFGLYVWELFITCDFEWSLITKRRKFRWPLASVLVGLLICFADSQIRVRGLYRRINLIELMHFPVFFFLCRYFTIFSLQMGCSSKLFQVLHSARNHRLVNLFLFRTLPNLRIICRIITFSVTTPVSVQPLN